MPHKLQMILNFEQFFSEDFKNWMDEVRYLRPIDIVRGIDCRLVLTAKNLGERDFPGGRISMAMVNYSGGVRHEIAPMEIPEIKVNEEKVILDVMISPLSEGAGSFEISLNARDGEPIECYQRRLDRPIGMNHWLGVFYTINRESLNIMWRLDRLLKRK